MALCLNFFRFNIGFEGLGLSQNGKMVEGKKVVFNKILVHKNQINLKNNEIVVSKKCSIVIGVTFRGLPLKTRYD